MTEFTPWMSLAGGVLIGLSALLLMAGLGRVAGITGILAGVLQRVVQDFNWRLAFLAGMVLAPWLLARAGVAIPLSIPVSVLSLAIGGVIVGVGATLGSGCTSGHGVCGNARGSLRSVAALFGIGWGIAGFCPGGSVPALALGDSRTLVFVAALVLGIGVTKNLLARR